MSTFPLESLRQTNDRLRSTIRKWQNPDDSSGIEPESLTGLLEELRQTAKLLGKVPSGPPLETEWERALSDYRSHAQQLEKLLPGVQGRLLAEKARLESARAHLAAAAAWMEGQKKTR